jgi:prolyl-tRNA synthetase
VCALNPALTTSTKIKHALPVKRSEDFAQWYQAVIAEAELAEESGVRGCMVIKPWGYGIWERIQKLMDERIKAAGVDNCYFPLFIPLSFFARKPTTWTALPRNGGRHASPPDRRSQAG